MKNRSFLFQTIRMASKLIPQHLSQIIHPTMKVHWKIYSHQLCGKTHPLRIYQFKSSFVRVRPKCIPSLISCFCYSTQAILCLQMGHDPLVRSHLSTRTANHPHNETQKDNLARRKAYAMANEKERKKFLTATR